MTTPNRPSALDAFMRGAGSGALSGTIMMGIIALLTPLFVPTATLVGTLFSASVGMTILATTLFGGVMSTKHALFDAPRATEEDVVAITTPTIAGQGMTVAPTIAMDESAQPQTSWVADTGRGEGAQTRIQQILANGATSDKDRASAILAAREAAANETTRSA